ncbi:MAG: hypothetical protein ACYC2E_05160 [Sulfuricella sp.]
MKLLPIILATLLIAGCQPGGEAPKAKGQEVQPPAKQPQPTSAPIPDTAPKSSGPLGLEMGTSLAELEKQMKLTPVSPGLYSTPTVPKTHSDFEDYMLVITPAHGLCKIHAWSAPINTSVYGSELISKFQSLEEALTSKYGTSKRFDYLRSGSIWHEPRYWMMALKKKERTLKTFWTEETGSRNSDNLSEIMLEAQAISTENALVLISYQFKNMSQCSSWIKSQKNSAL